MLISSALNERSDIVRGKHESYLNIANFIREIKQHPNSYTSDTTIIQHRDNLILCELGASKQQSDFSTSKRQGSASIVSSILNVCLKFFGRMRTLVTDHDRDVFVSYLVSSYHQHQKKEILRVSREQEPSLMKSNHVMMSIQCACT